MKHHPPLDLIVWPESMFPEPMWTLDAGARRPPDCPLSDAEFRARVPRWAQQTRSDMASVAASLGVPLLLGTGTNHCGRDGVETFASAVYVAPDGKLLGRYDKMHLVPFGEYVPLAEYIPWLQRLTPLPIARRQAGSRRPSICRMASERGEGREERGEGIAAGRTLPRSPTLHSPLSPLPSPLSPLPSRGRGRAVCRIAPNICYETVLSHVIRGQLSALTAAGREPDILINLTNDGWFWGSSELDLHLMCGVFRAVECRKPLLIAANTGFSAWIDGDGRIVRQGPRRAEEVVVAEPRLDRRRSWYLAHGDWFSGACLAVTVAVALAGCADRFRRRRSAHCKLSSVNENERQIAGS